MAEHSPQKPDHHSSVYQVSSEHIDDLIQVINRMDWCSGGLDAFDDIPHAHPLGPVFRSLARSKQQIDGLLHEHARKNQDEKKYRHILESIYDAYFEIDIQGDFLYYSPSFEKMLGYQKNELSVLNFWSLMDPENARSVSEIFDHAIQTSESNKGFEHKILRKDRKAMYVETAFSLILDLKNKPIGLQGVIRNITTKKQVENELIRARDDAEAVNRKLSKVNLELEKALDRAKIMIKKAQASTKEKSDFLANMSHEIRTPMNAIMGFTDLMLSTRLTGKQPEFLSLIRRSNDTLLGIIDDILDFSKIEAGKLSLESKKFKLMDVMDSLCDMFSKKASEKEIELILDLSPQVPRTINSDPLRLRQVLMNLITNAIKFTDKGEVVVKARLLRKKPDVAEVMFSVTDTGIGIEQNRISRLFEPFSQADGSTTRKYGGTGLGLTICKRLVEMMNGQIWAESEVGRGSRFYFKICFRYQASKEFKDCPVMTDSEKPNVLIVDDSKPIQCYLAEVMKQFSFQAASVGSGEGALKKLSRDNQGETYHLAIVDWKMPGMDGIELIERIRKNPAHGQMKIIMLTAFGNERVKYQAKGVGADAFLHKPIKESLLYDTILEVFGKKPLQESIEPPQDIIEPDLSGKFQGSRVLLVEDNSINQELALTILENEGLTVDIAKNGKEAIRAVDKVKYDLILMDVQMPKMDGYEATRHIRGQEKYNQIPIIAMTADAMLGTREECIMAGMDDYLAKPIHVKELFTKLSRWMDKNKPEKIQNRSISETNRTTPNLENMPAALPGINIQHALRRLGGNTDVYLKMLIRLGREYEKSPETIKKLIKKDDPQRARQLIHTIKGVAANLSAFPLYQAAHELGTAIKKNNVKQFNNLLHNYENELKTVLNSVGVLARNQDKKDIENEPAPKPSVIPGHAEDNSLQTMIGESD